MQAILDVFIRLVARVDVDANGCWNFRGATSLSGRRKVRYPAAHIFGKYWRLNRFMATFRHAPAQVRIDPTEDPRDFLTRCRSYYAEYDAAHQCDNSLCINPFHLEWEDHTSNVKNQHRRRR